MKKNVTSRAKGWQSTVLWAELRKRKDQESKAVLHTLEACMPSIEKILSTGNTSPSAFTLHDAEHSFRVAERMADITPATTLSKLSSAELALLLLSAYLHDIGMTPEERKVELHYQFLITGQSGDLSSPEIEAFQKWLDEEEHGTSLPLCKGSPTNQQLQLANELITHYCRHKHNDWSAEWIIKHLSGKSLGSYDSWTSDLITICKSHHEGRDSLLQRRFDPKLIGSKGQVVHLRYLACVLRTADVLEFDPERTPEVILRHRSILPNSLIYWYKDHAVSMLKEDDRITISAQPATAKMHRAIEEMIDQIDHELQNCRWLADETHFENCPGLRNKLPHRWNLQPSVHREINPKDNAYEYILGAFRPNTSKTLELLSGVALYGDKMAGVRELLQNAFDAIREQIAYEKLSNASPTTSDLPALLSQLHNVTLQIEHRGEDYWLICIDTGVGMSKSIIANHLLVSGQSRRHDILELERKCKNAGFTLGRTGQFGIGVLSYFMLCDRLIIYTRRSVEPGDFEANGWKFESAGIGDFGELRRDNSLTKGTRIELCLRKEITNNISQWYAQLRKHIARTLILSPCKFVLKPEPEHSVDVETAIAPGWTSKTSDLVQKFFEGWPAPKNPIPTELLSEKKRKKFKERIYTWMNYGTRPKTV